MIGSLVLLRRIMVRKDAILQVACRLRARPHPSRLTPCHYPGIAIVAQALLSNSDIPSAFFRHRRQQTPVPQRGRFVWFALAVNKPSPLGKVPRQGRMRSSSAGRSFFIALYPLIVNDLFSYTLAKRLPDICPAAFYDAYSITVQYLCVSTAISGCPTIYSIIASATST